MPEPLSGIIAPVAASLQADGSLDLPALRRRIQAALDGKVHGIYILGADNELPSLPMRLRAALVHESCDTVSGRVPVLVNAADTSFPHAHELAHHAKAAGASAVVLSSPSYYPLDQADVLAAARRSADHCPLPVVLDNVPQLAHNTFEPGTLRQLSLQPNIVGLKDSSGSLDYLRDVRDAVAERPDFSLLVADEADLWPALRAGAHGAICRGAIFFPSLYVRLLERVRSRQSFAAGAI